MENPTIKVSRGGKVIGDYSSEDIVKHLASGKIVKTDFYWKAGMSQWERLLNFPDKPIAASEKNGGKLPTPPPLPEVTIFHSSTGNTIPNFEIIESFGIVTGICVRCPTTRQHWGAIKQGLFDKGGEFKGLLELGGQMEAFEVMCEQARKTAFEKMILAAKNMGANAVIAVRHDSVEVETVGMRATEILCYGTAVKVIPSSN